MNLRRTICWLGCAVLFCLAVTPPLTGAQDLPLEQALSAAARKAELEDTAAPIARAQLQLLESASRRKFEFRPQLGLLSFSNPGVLASSLGLGFLSGFQNAPSKFAIQNARLEVTLAELARDRAKLRAQIETVHRFFDLLQKQQIADQTCAVSREAEGRLSKIDTLIQHHMLTAVDRVNHRRDTLNLQADCAQAEVQRKLASLQLALYVGGSNSLTDLRVQDPVSRELELDRPLPSGDVLLKTAMALRAEPKEVQETLDSVRKDRPRSPWRPVSFLLGYRNLNESGFGGGRIYDGNLLGGNIVSPELAWNVPLRQSGERSANRVLLDAKVRAVEMQLSAIQDDLRNEFETLRVLSAGCREKLSIARQKRDLSVEGMALAAVRFQHGLGSPASVNEAEKVALLAETDFVRTSYQLKADVYSVLVLCGAHQQPVQQQARVLRGQFTPDGSGF